MLYSRAHFRNLQVLSRSHFMKGQSVIQSSGCSVRHRVVAQLLLWSTLEEVCRMWLFCQHHHTRLCWKRLIYHSIWCQRYTITFVISSPVLLWWLKSVSRGYMELLACEMCLLVVGVCVPHGRNWDEADEAERGRTTVSKGEGGLFTVGRHTLVLCFFCSLSVIYFPHFLNLARPKMWAKMSFFLPVDSHWK